MGADANENDTDDLIDLARSGNRSAQQQLLMRYRDRLKRMIRIFLDPRLAPRVDPSDVLQETLAGAALRFDDFLVDQPSGFYPWLRQIARDRIVDAHRRHIGAEKRSVTKERRIVQYVSAESTAFLAQQLVSNASTPSAAVRRNERQRKMVAALQRLSDDQREVMLMRYVEQMSVAEIAEVLSITTSAVKSRLRRALENLQQQMRSASEFEL